MFPYLGPLSGLFSQTLAVARSRGLSCSCLRTRCRHVLVATTSSCFPWKSGYLPTKNPVACRMSGTSTNNARSEYHVYTVEGQTLSVSRRQMTFGSISQKLTAEASGTAEAHPERQPGSEGRGAQEHPALPPHPSPTCAAPHRTVTKLLSLLYTEIIYIYNLNNVFLYQYVVISSCV